MRLTTKLGERFSTVHSLIWRCLPSSSLSLNSKLIRLSLSDKWRRRGIMRMMGVTPASLSSDILLFTTPNNDSTESELAILLFLQRIVFIGFLFSALQVIHRLVVKFLDLVFKILFLILVLAPKFLIENKMLQCYR